MAETWYAVYDTQSRELRSVGSVLADPLPSGLSVKEYAERPDGGGRMWSPQLLDFVQNPYALQPEPPL